NTPVKLDDNVTISSIVYSGWISVNLLNTSNTNAFSALLRGFPSTMMLTELQS
ncbi:hypothetical protein C0J52_16408, partial [Blattella germanica]